MFTLVARPRLQALSNAIYPDFSGGFSVVQHEQLWAPWRLAYVSGEAAAEEAKRQATEAAKLPLLPGADPECFICRYVADSDDRKNLVVGRTDLSIMILNRFPYNNGHLLVAPLAHKASITELDDEELLDCMRQLQKMTNLYNELLKPDGFNVGLNLGRVAGAGVPGHLHWHLVPRWNGDTSFMPVLAETNVISQSLQELYRYLTERLGCS